MNTSEYTESGWLVVSSDIGIGITKAFKYDSFQEILSSSKQAMQIIKNKNALDSATVQLNGFECIISLRSNEADKVDDEALHVADMINEAIAI